MSYSWSTEEYSDHYSTDFDTIEECIKEAKEPKKRIRSCWRNRCLRSSWRLTARNDAIVARDVMHDPWDLDDCRLYA